ncbi:MAG: DegV family protein [Candidatus Dormibacteraeota bacterium]|nr:DegV family protein [Candidatus Dormibacteraeota bacterium]
MTSRRVALVVDSGAALEERIDRGLAVVPMHVVVGGATLDNSANGEVYTRLRRGEEASTSTPSPGDYLGAFEKLVGFETIICLTIPARWSGTFASATIAAELFRASHEKPTVVVVETPTAAVAYGLVARVANSLANASAGRDAVLARVHSACDEVRMYGALATLEFVARSGRVPSLVAGVSDALHVRPVFEMHGGGTGRVALARTDAGVQRALERAARERLDPSRPQWLMLFHADAAEQAARLREALLTACDVAEDETVALAPVIGVYTGPGAVGFAALPVHEADPPPAPR